MSRSVEWVSDFTLLPHHVTMYEKVRKAIAGKKYTNKVTSIAVLILAQRLDSSGYVRDFVGTSIGDILRVSKSEKPHLDTLRHFPENAIIHLDLTPDNFCGACAIGRHCTATNYRSLFFKTGDRANHEQYHVSKVHKALNEHDYREGQDFIVKPTSHTLFDFRGKKLHEINAPQPVSIAFKSLMVTMRALRNIIQYV